MTGFWFENWGRGGGGQPKGILGLGSRSEGERLGQADGGSSADEREKLRDTVELKSAGHGKPMTLRRKRGVKHDFKISRWVTG